jgi:hypothetical protein
MTTEKEGLFQVTVLRPKGLPIRPAYEHTVQVEPHAPVRFEGTCLVLRSDFDDETWQEILRRGSLGILQVGPYVEPKTTEPKHELIDAADKARKAIDAGEMSKPFKDGPAQNPPPPLMRISDPIQPQPTDWGQATREMRAMIEKPSPAVHDALTGEKGKKATTEGSRKEREVKK